MIGTAFRGMKPFTQLLFTAFITLTVFFVLQTFAAVMAIPVFGFHRVMGLLEGLDINLPENIALLKYFQVVQAIGLFIVPSLLSAWLMYENLWASLQLDRMAGLIPVLLVTVLIFAINPFINFTGALNSGMHLPGWLEGLEEWLRETEETAGNLTDAFLEVETFGGLLFNLFMIAILPALGEELLFRGVIQRILTGMTRNHHLGIWLSAALFSALHLQFFGFIPRLLLGAMFGYLLIWSGSLWLPILAHFINNAGAVIALWLAGKGVINPAVEEFGAGMEYWYYVLPSLVIGLFVLWVIRQQSVSRQAEV